MYSPVNFCNTQLHELHEFIERYSFGNWTALTSDGLESNSLPFCLCREHGRYGLLECHVAKANPIWRHFSMEQESIFVFQGPNSYVSPVWYPSKQRNQRAVPTWNYITVQVKGIPEVRHDEDWLKAHIEQLSENGENSVNSTWSVHDAPSEYIDKLVSAIVGIRIPIRSIEGKWKLGQHRSAEDQAGLEQGLLKKGDEQAQALAKALKDWRAR